MSYLYMLTDDLRPVRGRGRDPRLPRAEERRPPVALLPRHEVSAEVHEPGAEPVLRRWPLEPPAARVHDPVRRHRLHRRRGLPREPEPGLPQGRPALLLRRRQRRREDEGQGRRRGLRRSRSGRTASSRAKGTSSNHIPPLAVEKAGGWEPLIKRGQQQFNVHCAVCHGASGRGGGGDVGLRHRRRVRAERRAVEHDRAGRCRRSRTASCSTRSRTACGTMPAYGHQVKVQDRWAIVAYLRVLQYAAGNPA